MKNKGIGVITGIAIVTLIGGALLMNIGQQSIVDNVHKPQVTQQDTSFVGTHLNNPNDDQEAF